MQLEKQNKCWTWLISTFRLLKRVMFWGYALSKVSSWIWFIFCWLFVLQKWITSCARSTLGLLGSVCPTATPGACSTHKIKCDVLPATWPSHQIEEMTCLTDNIQCWGMLGKFTLILSALKSAVAFMSANLVSLIKSMCKKFQDIDLLRILVFYISFCNDKIISAWETGKCCK